MSSTRSSILDDKYSKALVLLAILLFSWLSGVKNFIADSVSRAEESTAPVTPNILLIVVDDLGYDDTTAINSSGLSTPNIRQLAQEGAPWNQTFPCVNSGRTSASKFA